MIPSCNTIVDKREHVQYLTVSKKYFDNCICSLTEQNTALNNLYYGLIQNVKQNTIKKKRLDLVKKIYLS